MKKLFLLAFAAAAFAACSNDDDNFPTCPLVTDYDVISFESCEGMIDQGSGEQAALGKLTYNLYDGSTLEFNDVFCAKPYVKAERFDAPLFSDAAQKIFFGSFFDSAYDAWGGIALSSNVAKTGDPKNLMPLQFTAYADGGARGSKNFAVCYDSNTPSEPYFDYVPGLKTNYGYPTIELTEPREAAYLFIANSTYSAVYFQDLFAPKANKKFGVKITGWLEDAETGSVEVELVGGGRVREGWQYVDLWALGKVDKIVLKSVIDDITKDPSFFCIDEIGFAKTAKK